MPLYSEASSTSRTSIPPSKSRQPEPVSGVSVVRRAPLHNQLRTISPPTSGNPVFRRDSMHQSLHHRHRAHKDSRISLRPAIAPSSRSAFACLLPGPSWSRRPHQLFAWFRTCARVVRCAASLVSSGDFANDFVVSKSHHSTYVARAFHTLSVAVILRRFRRYFHHADETPRSRDQKSWALVINPLPAWSVFVGSRRGRMTSSRSSLR